MRVIGIKINNYKSFGDNNNILRFDSEDTIALIGKNESGKSNTLTALKDLSFFESNYKCNIFEDNNRINNGEVIISIDVEFNKEDFPEKWDFISNYKSRFTFSKRDGNVLINFDGCISDILLNDKELFELSDIISKLPAGYQKEKEATILREKIKNYTNTYIKLINGVFNITDKNKKDYERFKELLEKYYEIFKNVLPKIIYFSNDMVLNNRYTYENISKKDNIVGLEFLLEALEFSLEDLKDWLKSTDSATKQKYKIQFQKKLDNFNGEFQKYYQTNKIELLFEVNYPNIEFTVRDDLEDDGTSITKFSERSDGLKWYLSMFIQLYSVRKKYRYCLVLIDEPGNSLHVIAQKKLLELLMDTQDIQIIYTTHSPYMIDINHLENIRLILKDKYTKIVNGINNPKSKNKKSYKETITPILEAIGLSLNYNFGPAPNKLNIIVEGITDYFYLKTMYKVLDLNIDKMPNIIPCIGATNESNIASILLGWGYEFICIFDKDNTGIEEYEKIKKSLDGCEDKLYYISDNRGDKVESLLSNDIKKVIKSSSKSISAKKFSDMVEKNCIEVDTETKENFYNLFKKIKIVK